MGQRFLIVMEQKLGFWKKMEQKYWKQMEEEFLIEMEQMY